MGITSFRIKASGWDRNTSFYFEAHKVRSIYKVMIKMILSLPLKDLAIEKGQEKLYKGWFWLSIKYIFRVHPWSLLQLHIYIYAYIQVYVGINRRLHLDLASKMYTASSGVSALLVLSSSRTSCCRNFRRCRRGVRAYVLEWKRQTEWRKRDESKFK